eukprot:5361980-Prymnesium_polylepis.1
MLRNCAIATAIDKTNAIRRVSHWATSTSILKNIRTKGILGVTESMRKACERKIMAMPGLSTDAPSKTSDEPDASNSMAMKARVNPISSGPLSMSEK